MSSLASPREKRYIGSMKAKKASVRKKGEPAGLFCLSCGEELENFSVSSDAADIEAIRKRHAKCVGKGKFDGEFCARLFIADPATFSQVCPPSADEPEPARRSRRSARP